ncbi:MAG: hypothetical protein AAFO73_00515 [Pseudomonadota bacterium]
MTRWTVATVLVGCSMSLGVGIGLTASAITPADAAQRYDSNIREAAIERMQEKLGTLRGSIAPKARNVRLTDQMIELIAPIRPNADTPLDVGANRPADIDRPGSADIDQTTTASSQSQRPSRIERKRRDRGTSDVDAIMRAVEAMLDGQ